jgi:hypothetical protein
MAHAAAKNPCETVVESTLLTRRDFMKYQDELANLTSFYAQQ